MALLTFKSQVEYDQQQSKSDHLIEQLRACKLTRFLLAAFESFLEAFKTSKTASVADGLLDMNIDDDDISDEYDFAESDEEAQEARRAARKQASMPHNKYMDMLQQVANRQQDEVTIELDDLFEVCMNATGYDSANVLFYSMRSSWRRRAYISG
jgi:MCM N-terminal domain